MEGNFYVSEVVIRNELKSNFAKCTLQCPTEMKSYAKCVESLHVNKALKKDVCKAEREALRSCTDRNWHALAKENRASHGRTE